VTDSERIAVVDLAGGRSRVLPGALGQDPAWSPDGRTIAFVSGDGSLWLANADGTGGARQVTDLGGSPSWAPDSRRVVVEVRYYRGRYLRKPQLLSIVDTRTGAVRKLTHGE
jgi:Tol biopolymer transport system component